LAHWFVSLAQCGHLLIIYFLWYEYFPCLSQVPSPRT